MAGHIFPDRELDDAAVEAYRDVYRDLIGFVPPRIVARTDLLGCHSARLGRALLDFDHPRFDLPWDETGLRFYGSEIWKAERYYQIVHFKQCVQALESADFRWEH